VLKDLINFNLLVLIILIASRVILEERDNLTAANRISSPVHIKPE